MASSTETHRTRPGEHACPSACSSVWVSVAKIFKSVRRLHADLSLTQGFNSAGLKAKLASSAARARFEAPKRGIPPRDRIGVCAFV
jgi:hypothetical protein